MPAFAAPSSERRFYTSMAIAILAAVLVGFARSFFLRPLFPDTPSPAERVFYAHGALFTTWIVLLVVQTSLVARGRLDVHRRLGAYGAALAGVMVAVGLYVALVAATRPGGFIGIPAPPLAFLIVPFVDMMLFGALVALAIAKRRDPQSHKRLMLLATINLTTAAIARIPGVIDAGPIAFFALTDAFIVALVVWDVATLRRLHPATLWGGLATIVSQPMRLVLSGSDAWLAFAAWMASLV